MPKSRPKSRRQPAPPPRPGREPWRSLALRVLVFGIGAGLVWISLTLGNSDASYGLLILCAALLSGALFFRGPVRPMDRVVICFLGLILALPAVIFVTLAALVVEDVSRG